MTTPIRTRLFNSPVLAAFLLLAVAGCGWVEVDSRPRPVNYPPPDRTPPSSSAFVNATAVIVGRGDTVYSIARRHKLSVRAIIDANAMRPPYKLTVGQRLKLPRARAHRIVRGDTLGGIARRYNVDMYDLARLNGLRPPYVIHAGRTLTLPGGAPPPTQTAKAPVGSAPSKSKSITSRPAPKPVTVPPPPPPSGSGFAWPLRGRLVSNYGPKTEGLHNDGINIAAAPGTPVKAAQNGVVAYAGNELRGFGNLLLIKHSGGWITAYAHNSTLLVKRGQKVKRGQAIARVGSTGSVSSPQLHFELRKGKRAVDPKRYIKGSV